MRKPRKPPTDAEYEEKARQKDARERETRHAKWANEDHHKRRTPAPRRPSAFDGLFDDASNMSAEDV